MGEGDEVDLVGELRDAWMGGRVSMGGHVGVGVEENSRSRLGVGYWENLLLESVGCQLLQQNGIGCPGMALTSEIIQGKEDF
jgi:hypothetical protein